MAATFMSKMLNVIGIENEPADDQNEVYDEYEEDQSVRRTSFRNSREDRDQQRDYDRYDNTPSYDYDDDGYEEDYRRSSYDSKIVSHPSVAPRHRMMIYQLSTYEDARDVIDDLLESHSVLINLEGLDLEEAQRIIDTLIGACYAINATIKKAAQQTYLLAPETVEVAGTYAEDNRQRSIFN